MADTPYPEDKAVAAQLSHGSNANGHEIHESQNPEKMSVGRYAATRVSTLKPPMLKAPNPIRLLRMLNTKQWLFFLVGFFAWVSGHPIG